MDESNGLHERIAVGSVQEAEVALARLLGVTRAAVERSGQLQQALESRIVIEQAKGILAERFGVGVDEAFELIRRGARSHHRRLRELAAEVVTSQETPSEIGDPRGERTS
jgi:AmiR/NasT family two-component response regulator